MLTEPNAKPPLWQLPVLCVIALLLVLGMLRLGIWQLDRAEEKAEIVTQLKTRLSQVPTSISALENDAVSDQRFRSVTLSGRYLDNQNLLLDNQVVNGSVGYQVFTPFKPETSERLVLIARGWVSVGESRDTLPVIETSTGLQALEGRLNKLPVRPPLWSDDYAVRSGSVWQYLPIDKVSSVLNAKVYPLVVELAPEASDSTELVRKWPDIDDQWVAKHQGYAFQWFAMAFAFFIACLVLLLRVIKRKTYTGTV